MARIAVGGWQHETNTFAIKKADYAAFEQVDEWPRLEVGEQMLQAIEGVHLPITGAIQALTTQDHEIIPLLWCSATPCAHVTEHAFEAISRRLLALIEAALPLDAIYLDLHGAMVCEHFEDGEGEFLSRLRRLVGNEMPVFVSLDLHANITALMVEKATLLDVFRTYPHIDMGETGFRTGMQLLRCLHEKETLYKAYRQIDFLIALNWGCSLIEPCKTLYQELPGLIREPVVSLSFACGFHLSDIYDVGAAVVSYGKTQAAADNAADTMVRKIASVKKFFYQKIWPAEAGVIAARRAFKEKRRTIVLADTQDNPGGGGSGDTTGVLRALIKYGVKNAVFGALSDPEIVHLAQQAGIGGEFPGELGGKSGLPGQCPFPCRMKVVNLTDGHLVATGPMYKGARMSIGPCALIDIGGVLVMVSSKPVQTADQAIFRHVGIEPAGMDVIALKSSVHFRNDFAALAGDILLVSAPGAVFANPAELAYRNIRQGLEIISA